MTQHPLFEKLLKLSPEARLVQLLKLSEIERQELRHHWQLWARAAQLPPERAWQVWLILAGRGFAKTRAGAEWVRRTAEADPEARIALVAASLGEARSVMVEGESGLLASAAPGRIPQFEPSLRRLTWPNGAQATLYSAGEPESLRGPQHSHAWCDEIAKWENANERAVRTWDNLQMGMRLGEMPQVLATTTPRSVPLLRQLLASPDVAVHHGKTEDNRAFLPARFIAAMKHQYGQTALGRQELDGELLEDIEGALWTRALLEEARETACSAGRTRTVVAVDPPVSGRGDACGIVVAARLDAMLHCAIEAVQAAPPVAPADGQSWLIAAGASGEWNGRAGQIAMRQAGNWLYSQPNDGMRIFNRATHQDMLFDGGWQTPSRPAAPAGGATVDAEARTAIAAIIASLTVAGIIPAS